MPGKRMRVGAAGLAAMFALAVAAGPAVSGAFADTKWGHLGIGQQGTITINPNTCADYQSLYDSSINDMHNAIAAGDYAGAFKDLDQAAKDRGTAHDIGCGWAWT